MRRRREPLKWGASFMARVEEFKAGQIKAIERQCRKYLRELQPLELGAKSHIAERRHFVMFGYDLVLHYDLADEVWELNVDDGPRTKGPRRPSGKAQAERHLIQAVPARARQPRKKSLKRTLLSLYKTVEHSAFGRFLASFRPMLATFADDTSSMIDIEAARAFAAKYTLRVCGIVRASIFTGCEALNRTRLPASERFSPDFHLVRGWFGQRVGIPLVLSGYMPCRELDQAPDMSWVGQQALESERIRL